MKARLPEEKLLDLIKQKKIVLEKKENQETEGQISWEELVEPWALVDIKSYEFNWIHKILGGIIGVLFLYNIITFYNYFFDKQHKLPFQKPLPRASQQETNIVSSKPLSYYKIIGKRKLFKLYAKPRIKRRTTHFRQTDSLQKKLRTLKLLGIIWDEGIPQVIIQDRKNRKTYSVFEGEMVGDIKIEKISDGKVIVSFFGEKGELQI